MEERLFNLLRLAVEDHIESAEPVASGPLGERYGLDVSPATIRNWLGELDRQGYLIQPHTSGGRVPTEKAYRLYIDEHVKPRPAPKREKTVLEKAALQGRSPEERLKYLAKALAELSGLASIAAFYPSDTFYTGLSQLFSQPEFKNWQRVVSLTELLDHLDEHAVPLLGKSYAEPTIRLGTDCAFGEMCGSVLLSTKKGMLAVLGPIRMDYQRTLSLMNTANELI